MGFCGLFFLYAFVQHPNSVACVAFGAVGSLGFPAREFIAWALLPCSDTGQHIGVLQSCPLSKAAQNNLTLNNFCGEMPMFFYVT